MGRGLVRVSNSEFEQEQNTTFYFLDSFCCFRLNKSVLGTNETKQVDSQLHFAPKIIKFCLVIFENELIEVAWVILKTSHKRKHIGHAGVDSNVLYK